MKRLSKRRFFFRNVKLKNLVILLAAIEVAAVIAILSAAYMQQYRTANAVASQSTHNALQQVQSNLQYNMDQIQNAANLISYNTYVSKFLLATDISERREMSGSVLSLLNNTEKLNENIFQILLLDRQANLLSSNGSVYSVNSGLGYSYYSMVDPAMLTDPLLTESYADGTLQLASPLNVRLYSYTIPIYSVLASSSLEKIGLCVFVLQAGHVEKLLESFEFAPGTLLSVQDSAGEFVYTNDSAAKELVQSLDGEQANGKSVRIDGTQYMVGQTVFEPLGWKITSIISQKVQDASLRRILTVWVVTCLGATLLIVVIATAIIRSITRPVSKIAEFTSHNQWKGEGKRLVIDSTNEIGLLAQNINQMLDEIRQANEEVLIANTRLYEAQLSQKQTELCALQSQINPHFLYNTLDCIRSIALVGGIQEIATISEAMSHIFRYSIKADDIVVAEQELKCVKAYMEIMQTRFPNKLTFEMDIDPEAARQTIPKMILQPIVENAVYHGLEAKRGTGTLRLCGRLIEESVLCFEVTDDGVGMEPETVGRLNRELSEMSGSPFQETNRRSIGLRNIMGRLRLVYGERCGMRVISKRNICTTIRLYMEISPRSK